MKLCGTPLSTPTKPHCSSEFCLFFFLWNTHGRSGEVSWLVEGVDLTCRMVCDWGTLPPLVLGPWSRQIWNLNADSESQEVRRIKLFRVERSWRWKKFFHQLRVSANGLTVIQSHLSVCPSASVTVNSIQASEGRFWRRRAVPSSSDWLNGMQGAESLCFKWGGWDSTTGT
jgi:hypothetical protein